MRSPITWSVIVIGVVAFAVAMYLFQPWRLFTTVEVNEALPAPAASTDRTGGGEPVETRTAKPAPKIKTLSTGKFISHEHSTSGMAKVLELGNGDRVLRIEDLDTSDGPDLR